MIAGGALRLLILVYLEVLAVPCERLLQLLRDFLVPLLAEEVVELVGVFLHVVELLVVDGVVVAPHRCAVEVDELVSVVAHTVVTAHVVLGRVVVVMVVDVFSPAFVVAVEEVEERAPRHVGGLLHAGGVEHGGREVDVLHEPLLHRARLDGLGVTHDEGCAEALLIHEPLVKPSVLAHVEALVGAIDEDGVVEQAVALEILVDVAHTLVHGVDDGEVIVHVALVFPDGQRAVGEVGLEHGLVARRVVGVPRLLLQVVHACQSPLAHGAVELVDLVVVGELHVLGDGHLLLLGAGASCGVVVPEGGGQGERDLVVEAEILEVGHPRAVGSLVLHEEEEGLLLVAAVEELHSVLGHEVCGVALLAHVLAAGVVGEERGVVVVALVPEDAEEVEALGAALHVPLADDGRLVARVVQELGDKGLGGVNALVEGALPALVAVEACEQAGARRGGE